MIALIIMFGPLEPHCASLIAAFGADTRALALMSVSSEWGISVAARLTHRLLMPPALESLDDATPWRQLDWRHWTVMNVVDGFLTATLLATAYDLVMSLTEDLRGSNCEE